MANATLSAIQEVKIPSNEAEAAAEGAKPTAQERQDTGGNH